MSKDKLKIIKIIIVIIIIIISIFIVKQYQLYINDKRYKNAQYNYDDKQMDCVQVGENGNYIYIYRYSSDGSPIIGSKWKVTDKSGKEIGKFEIKSKGTGGVVGLDYGEYYLQEIEAPEGHKLLDEKYRAIISKADTSYVITVKDELIGEDEEEK